MDDIQLGKKYWIIHIGWPKGKFDPYLMVCEGTVTAILEDGDFEFTTEDGGVRPASREYTRWLYASREEAERKIMHTILKSDGGWGYYGKT